MNITDVNNILKSKRPTAKTPAVAASKPDAATLKRRIAEARKQIGQVFAAAQKLGAARSQLRRGN